MNSKEVQALREQYPSGSRIVLRKMKDDPHPLEPGATGTLLHIDGLGSFHTLWDDGQRLAVIPGVDEFDVTVPESVSIAAGHSITD